MTTRRARSQCVFGGLLALGVVTLLFACESGEPRARETTDTDAGTDSGTKPPTPNADDAGSNSTDADSGDDDFVVPDASVACGTGPCAVMLTGHSDSFCVVLQSGKTSCWGSNTSGQLGYAVDGEPFSATPQVLGDLANVTSTSIGESNACARVGSGEVFCWGAPDLVNAGMLPMEGNEAFTGPVTQPTRMTAVATATNIAVGKDFACATASDGSLSCWGTNASQELGRGADSDAGTMEPPAKAQRVTQPIATVAPGVGRTFAITSNGDLLSWGAGSLYGRDDFNRLTNLVDYLLGRDISEDVDGFPALVPGLEGVRGLASSSRHVCAVVGRDVECWGSNELGQLGRGSFNPAPTVFQLPPSFLPDVSNVRFVADAEETDAGESEKDVPIQVAVADEHSCAVMGSGRVYCWGKKGDLGVLGTNATQDLNGTPTRIDGLSEPAVGVASAGSTVCALLRSGAVECWGSNGQGQLGTGTADDLPHPTPSRVLLPN